MISQIDQRGALAPSRFVDSDHSDVRDFTESIVRGVQDPRERIGLLFAAVRDRLRYDPYRVTAEAPNYRASAILNGGPTWCVPKAVLLTASLRAAGIPAVLGFSDVRNHLNSATLLALMGTDLFVYHGWSAVHIDGQWRKGSPAFNSDLCRRFGVAPLEFDGSSDALLHETDGAGRRHMQYVRERGMFVDLPFDAIMTTLRDTYGPAIMRDTDTQCPADPHFRA